MQSKQTLLIMAKTLKDNLNILTRVADRLVNGEINSANIAHDGLTVGYTIRNVVGNIERLIGFENNNDESNI